MKKLYPILPGDKIGLISPAGPVKKEQIQKGLDTLAKYGIQYEFGKHAFSNHGIVSASANNRLEDINRFLKQENIKALWALRGGYGSMQLLKKIDYSLIKQYLKPLIGFSDLTALQWAIFEETGLSSFSGFTLTSQLCDENPFIGLGMEVLSGKRTEITEKDLQGGEIRIINPGEAEGILIGGTLSMICSLCGTPYLVDRDDLIIYLDDVNEPLYRIDRYLQQLALIDFWSKVKGVILGQFLNDNKSLDAVPLIKPFLPDSIPIISGFPYGHQTNCMLLIQGASVHIRTNPFQIIWKPIFR